MKGQYRYLAFVFLCLLLVSFGLFVQVDASEYDHSGGQFLGFLAMLAGVGLGLRNLVMSIKWFNKALRFKKIFGLSAPGVDWKNEKLLEHLVDTKLSMLAETLHNYIKDEDRIRENKPASVEETQKALRALKQWSRLVEQSKKQFWTARNLAWEYGIGVFDSFKDYYPSVSKFDYSRKRGPLP